MPTVLLKGQLVATHDPISATEQDRPAVQELVQILHRAHVSQKRDRPRLLGLDHESVQLPEPLFRVLRDVAEQLLQGNSVTIVPIQKELTTQQAADLLNVSRPYLVGLLDRGEMPCVKTVGGHRRVQFGDLMAYKQKRDAQTEAALDRLSEMSEDLNLYPEYE